MIILVDTQLVHELFEARKTAKTPQEKMKIQKAIDEAAHGRDPSRYVETTRTAEGKVQAEYGDVKLKYKAGTGTIIEAKPEPEKVDALDDLRGQWVARPYRSEIIEMLREQDITPSSIKRYEHITLPAYSDDGIEYISRTVYPSKDPHAYEMILRHYEKQREYVILKTAQKTPEIDYLLSEAETEEAKMLETSILQAKEIPPGFVGPIQKTPFDIAVEKAYHSLTPSEKEEYGYKFTEWSEIPVEKSKYYVGGKKYLESLPPEKREELALEYIEKHVEHDPWWAFGSAWRAEGEPIPGMLSSKMATVEGKEELGWVLISKTPSEVKSELYAGLPSFERKMIAAGETIASGMIFPVTLTQKVITHVRGETFFLPDIEHELGKRKTAPYGVLLPSISEVWLRQEVSEEIKAKQREYPVETAFATVGEVFGLWLGGKMASGMATGAKLGATRAWSGALRYTGTKPYDIFVAKARISAKLEEFAVGRGLISPADIRLASRLLKRPSISEGIIAYEGRTALQRVMDVGTTVKTSLFEPTARGYMMEYGMRPSPTTHYTKFIREPYGKRVGARYGGMETEYDVFLGQKYFQADIGEKVFVRSLRSARTGYYIKTPTPEFGDIFWKLQPPSQVGRHPSLPILETGEIPLRPSGGMIVDVGETVGYRYVGIQKPPAYISITEVGITKAGKGTVSVMTEPIYHTIKIKPYTAFSMREIMAAEEGISRAMHKHWLDVVPTAKSVTPSFYTDVGLIGGLLPELSFDVKQDVGLISVGKLSFGFETRKISKTKKGLGEIYAQDVDFGLLSATVQEQAQVQLQAQAQMLDTISLQQQKSLSLSLLTLEEPEMMYEPPYQPDFTPTQPDTTIPFPLLFDTEESKIKPIYTPKKRPKKKKGARKRVHPVELLFKEII